MLHFQYSTLIDAPVEVVWDFHERQDILQKLTPPWQPVEIVRREGGLEVGAITEFKIFLGLIPIRWIARHTECELYRLFTDEQLEGPMTCWTHCHQFIPEQGKTRLTDAIAFSMPGGELADSLFGWFVLERLEDMFRYRHEVTQRECENNGV
jgi:ligand-binding SRPBCC domain-containing protein